MELKEKIAIKVRTYRVAAGLTQTELADRIGRSHDVISNIERGLTSPTLEILEAISSALDIGLLKLLVSDDFPPRLYGSQ